MFSFRLFYDILHYSMTCGYGLTYKCVWCMRWLHTISNVHVYYCSSVKRDVLWTCTDVLWPWWHPQSVSEQFQLIQQCFEYYWLLQSIYKTILVFFESTVCCAAHSTAYRRYSLTLYKGAKCRRISEWVSEREDVSRTKVLVHDGPIQSHFVTRETSAGRVPLVSLQV